MVSRERAIPRVAPPRVVKGRLPLDRAPPPIAAMRTLLVFVVLLMAVKHALARTRRC
jgi:hypothetical protein